MKNILIAFVFAALPAALFAQDPDKYQCSLDEMTRRVEVLSEPGVAVPCEVHYFKDTEAPGEVLVLWRAANEVGYCESQAAGFVEELRGMGWTCWAGSRAADEEMSEPDDTDALAPAEEIEIQESEPPR